MASYPGTPSTEIAESLAKAARRRGIHVEWSTNEKVAYEVAYGASLAGVRSLMSTKHLGMNWIADPLIVSAYTGTNAGLVVAVADDTHPYSSQNAADSRYFSKLANIPCLEPSSPQEAKELTVEAFELSEKLSLPVLLRLTTRVSHTRADVTLGALSDERREPHFTKDCSRYVVIASVAQKRHAWLNVQMDKCREMAETFPWNTAEEGAEGGLGIVTEGITYGYAVEAAKNLGVLDDVSILKLGMANPLPSRFLTGFLKGVSKALVLEENEPILERDLKAIAYSSKLSVEILGRETGQVPRELELNPDVTGRAIEMVMGVDPPRPAEALQVAEGLSMQRTPYLCAGCPHRASYHVIGEVLRKLGGGIVLGDRGCYNQGVHPPLNALDTCICMGASIGLANGFAKSGLKEPIVAVLGDSTFFHAGIPALINAVTNKSSFVTIVFDNSITAMTGHQPAPTTGLTAKGDSTKQMKVEDIAKAIGVEYVRVLDPLDINESRQRLEEAIRRGELVLIVFRRPCAIQERRLARMKGLRLVHYKIDVALCTKCKFCISKIGCPAIEVDGERIWIDADQCSGCGLCVKICRFGAISKQETG